MTALSWWLLAYVGGLAAMAIIVAAKWERGQLEPRTSLRATAGVILVALWPVVAVWTAIMLPIEVWRLWRKDKGKR